MSKYLLAECYDDNKGRLERKLVKDIKVLPKKRKEKATLWP